jgi:hypothetical protein
MDAFPYNTGADADKSRLKIIRTVTAPSQSSGRARKRDGQQMTTNRQDPDALLTREQTAAALTACGFPIKARTLSTQASRGGGPPYQLFGPRVLYRWGDALKRAQARLTTPRRSTSEGDASPAPQRRGSRLSKAATSSGAIP